MRGSRAVGSALIMGALLLGCKGDEKKEEVQELNVQSAAAEAADIMCQALVSCSCTDGSAIEDCRVAYADVFLQTISQWQVAFPGQKIDPAGARACLDEFRTMAAECRAPSFDYDFGRSGLKAVREPEPGLQLCKDMDGFFVGTQTEGEPCNWDGECVPALACDEATRTCASRTALGGRCYEVACVEGLICSYGTCVEVPAVGEACPSYDCQDGARCVYDAETDEDRCVALPGLGEECTTPDDCVEGAFCCSDDVFCSDVIDRCAALLADGADCLESSQCTSGWCNGYDSKCTDPGFCRVMDY